jgi:hypothetical protein
VDGHEDGEGAVAVRPVQEGVHGPSVASGELCDARLDGSDSAQCGRPGVGEVPEGACLVPELVLGS